MPSAITEPSDACVGHFVAARGLDAQPAEELDTCMACPILAPSDARVEARVGRSRQLESFKGLCSTRRRRSLALVCADVVDARDLDF